MLFVFLLLLIVANPIKAEDQGNLSIQVEGSNPSSSLATLYALLVKEYPDNFKNTEVTYCSEFPWNKLIDDNIWPKSANIITPLSTSKELIQKSNPKCYFSLKNIEVEELAVVRTEVLQNLNQPDLNDETKKAICNKGKKNGTKGPECILSAIKVKVPPEPKRSKKYAKPKKKKELTTYSVRVFFQDQAYKVRLKLTKGGESTSDFRKEIINKIANQFTKSDDTERVIIYTPQKQNDIDIHQVNLEPTDNVQCPTIDSLIAQKIIIDRLAGWPNFNVTEPRHAGLVILDPKVKDVFGNSTEIKSIGNIIDSSSLNPRTKELLANPFLRPESNSHTISIKCDNVNFLENDFLKDTDLGMLSHVLAVSSATFSNLISINRPQALAFTGVGSRKRISGFLPPSSLGIGSDIAIFTPPELESHIKRYVVMAPFQGTPPTYDKSLAKPEKPLAEPLKQITTLINSKVSVLVISASKKKKEEDIDYPKPLSQLDEWQKMVDACSDWPACLGATPYAITVAPLDLKGELLKFDPISKEPYKLGGSVISIAAPALEIPALANVNSQNYGYSGFTGTSVGISSVSALALKLTSLGVEDVRSRILATSNLNKTFDDLLGFGTLNASRAFIGLINSQGGINSDDWGDMVWDIKDQDQRKDFTSSDVLSGVKAQLKGVNYKNVCNQSLTSPKGYIPYFLPEESVTYDANQSKQAQLKCIPVHRLLRLRQEGNSQSGGLPFTIVYYDQIIAGRIAPTILRNAVLNDPNEINQCLPTEFQQVGSFNEAILLGKTKPCLWNDVTNDENPEGVGIDLKGKDIIFNPENIKLEKGLFPEQL